MPHDNKHGQQSFDFGTPLHRQTPRKTVRKIRKHAQIDGGSDVNWRLREEIPIDVDADTDAMLEWLQSRG